MAILEWRVAAVRSAIEMEDRLNDLCPDGWHLHSIVPQIVGTTGWLLTFQREKK